MNEFNVLWGGVAINILIVEDEADLSARIGKAVRQSGFVCEFADNGHDAVLMGQDGEYDAIVLDLGLPEMSGVEVLKSWRQMNVNSPVLILTARNSWTEKVEALNLGADDYLTKPFHTPELVARLNALLRRVAGQGTPILRQENLELDIACGRVTLDGVLLELTAFEYKLLRYFMSRVGHIVSQSEITEHLYALDDMRGSNTIEVYISRLRRLIGSSKIKTIRGLGYRFG